MKRDEILNMKSGPEMDRLISEVIFGFTVTQNGKAAYHKKPNGYSDMHYLKERKYSTDIAAAWQVVEKLTHETGEMHDYRFIMDLVYDSRFGVKIGLSGWVFCDNAPLAICRAALLAVMELE